MKFGEGNILKRKQPHPQVLEIAVVVETDSTDNTVEVLQFDQDGPFTTRLQDHHVEDLFEVDNG